MKTNYSILTTTICESIADAARVAARCIGKRTREPGMTIKVESNLGVHFFGVTETKSIEPLVEPHPA